MSGRQQGSRRRYQVLGLVFLLVAGLFFATTIGTYRKAFGSVVPVTLKTDHIGNQMREGADVKVRGVVVGEVRSIEPGDGHAALELALQPEMAKMLPPDVSAQLLPKTLFGERYVALHIPGKRGVRTLGAKHLAAGDVIAQDRSSSAMEIEKVLDDLLPVLQAVQPQKLATTLNAVSQALEGRGEQLGDTLVQLDAYLDRFNPSLPDFESVIGRIDDVADTYARAAPDLMQALGDLTTTTRTIADQRAQLQQMFSSVTTTSVDMTHFLEVNQNNFIRLTGTSRSTLELLGRYAPEYPCMLKQFVDGIPPGEKTFGKGSEHPDVQKVTIEITASRGKYLPGRDTPRYLDKRGPRCYPWVEAPDTFPQYPPGGPIEDGSFKPEPPKERSPLPLLGGPATTAPQSAEGAPGPPLVANSPAEQRLLAALVAPSMGVPPPDVPGWSSLLVGPLFRGTEVTVR